MIERKTYVSLSKHVNQTVECDRRAIVWKFNVLKHTIRCARLQIIHTYADCAQHAFLVLIAILQAGQASDIKPAGHVVPSIQGNGNIGAVQLIQNQLLLKRRACQ